MSYRATYTRIMTDIAAKAQAAAAVPMSDEEARQLHERVMRESAQIIGARPSKR